MSTVLLLATGVISFVADPWMVAQATGEGYYLPLEAKMVALMPLVMGTLAILRAKVSAVEKYHKIVLPVLAVLISIGLSIVTGLTDPVVAGIGIGAATCYSYDLGKGVVKAVGG